MTTVSAPFGFRPTRSAHSGTGSEVPPEMLQDAWATGLAGSIGTGCPIKLATDGTILLMAAGDAAFYGVFAGCFYVDSSGRERTTANWVGATAATNIRAFIWRNPFMEYFVQASATMAQSAIGDEANHIAGTVNTLSGLSADQLGTLVGAGGGADFRVVGLAAVDNNAWGDTFPIVRVVPNRSAGILPNQSAV